jgi:hypothetical protein
MHAPGLLRKDVLCLEALTSQVVQPLEDLGHIAHQQLLVQFSRGAVLGLRASAPMICSSKQASTGTATQMNPLKYNGESVLVSGQPVAG